MLLDEVKIKVQSGNGGKGAATFRREKHVPLGGPDGGNGGKGASVVLQVNDQYNTLLDLGEGRTFKGDDGVKGGGGRRTGKSGKDLIIGVPKGTVVKNLEGKILADLTESGESYTAVDGGRGGRGNYTFRSSTNQTPDHAMPGKEGQETTLCLELKLMADVGLVGFPNAGKSSLVNKISSGRPKVGDYPFTTLEPVLGIVQMSDFGSFVMADIPGILEGASKGKGLGHQFLKHIERTSTLLFVIDAWEMDAYEKFLILRNELKDFHPALIEKPFIVALNKADLGIEESLERFKEAGQKVYPVSAWDGEGTKKLVRALENHIRPSRPKGWGSENAGSKMKW